jgi:hypothetical protein
VNIISKTEEDLEKVERIMTILTRNFQELRIINVQILMYSGAACKTSSNDDLIATQRCSFLKSEI